MSQPRRNRSALLFLSVAAVAGGALLFALCESPSTTDTKRAPHAEHTPSTQAPTQPRPAAEGAFAPGQAGARAASVPKDPARDPSREARARRDALRAHILKAQQSRPQQSPEPAPQKAPEDDRDRPGTLVDRVGGRDALVGHLNREFMPLARECIQQATERSPELEGMLALGVEVIADEELGGVVDVAEAAPSNDVHAPGLLECIRETAKSVTFPTPLVTGREQFMLTLRVQPSGAVAAPP